MNEMQQELVQRFCEARLVRDQEYKVLWDKYSPVQNALAEHMIENNLKEIILSDDEKLELHLWKRDGIDTYSIWWRKAMK